MLHIWKKKLENDKKATTSSSVILSSKRRRTCQRVDWGKIRARRGWFPTCIAVVARSARRRLDAQVVVLKQLSRITYWRCMTTTTHSSFLHNILAIMSGKLLEKTHAILCRIYHFVTSWSWCWFPWNSLNSSTVLQRIITGLIVQCCHAYAFYSILGVRWGYPKMGAGEFFSIAQFPNNPKRPEGPEILRLGVGCSPTHVWFYWLANQAPSYVSFVITVPFYGALYY